MTPELRNALVEEACRKSSILWLSFGDESRAHPAWHVWADAAVNIVAARTEDSDEQRLPGLAEHETVSVICRSKDARNRLVRWQARVRSLAPGTPEWDDACKALRHERLNTTDVAGITERWAASALIVRLEPTGEVTEYPGEMPTEEGAAPPPDSPATTRGKLPWVLGRRARKARRLS